MTGVKLRTSGIESDHYTDWATTTSQPYFIIIFFEKGCAQDSIKHGKE